MGNSKTARTEIHRKIRVFRDSKDNEEITIWGVTKSMKWLQSLSEIVIDNERCPHTATEFLEYEYERDKNGDVITGYPDKNNHAISTPTYTTQELREMSAKELEKHFFEGKEYNKCEATQMQRKFETAIRREKDRTKAFAASGDTEAERIALAKSAALNSRYKEFSEAVELTPRSNRTTVANFTRSQAGKLGWETRKTIHEKYKDALGTESITKTLVKMKDIEYNNDKWLLDGYVNAVQKGDINALVAYGINVFGSVLTQYQRKWV